MNLISITSQANNAKKAVKELTRDIATHNKSLSTYVIYFTDNYHAEDLYEALSESLPDIPFIGCTSCKGVMTEKGYFEEPAIALLGIYDDGISAYGTGFSDLNHFSNDIELATESAIKQALKTANRVGEVPSLIILHSTPGNEEQIIRRMDSFFGTLVPIIGGSSADSTLNKSWAVISDKAFSKSGIALSLLFPSKSVSSGFSAGYSPTEFVGTITKSDGRVIYEIDGEPANSIYLEWISDHSNIKLEDNISLEYITSFPLGRVVGKLYEQPYYKLTHPLSLDSEGPMAVFANVEEGEEITLMTGHKEQLVNRASRVIKEANAKNYAESVPLGAILIICAGAMLRLGDDIHKVQERICEQLHNQPFICPFTYGEQGRFTGGQNAHGNLMISTVIFYESE
ncbi:FIST signal transduction protein [Vibrio salinus]|uniref:FIST signal transduction protein n=1 Tax=Vibrio salinus TaxID=2899784 RepID=UPI001E291D07|nr:FIST N-terminal domain-containing protein [Vibrio salinus]MCE0492538.1 FIST C-terminal domain-containing protein [Vibrio salinus]